MDGLDHFQVIHAVAESDGILHGHAQRVADPEDPSAFVIFAVDQLPVQAAFGFDMLEHKSVVFFQSGPGLVQLAVLQAHDDDLVDGPAVPFADGMDVQLPGQGRPPAFDLTVAAIGRAVVRSQKFIQLLIPVGTVFGFDRAEYAAVMKGTEGCLRVLPGHGHIIDHFIADGHITAGAGHYTVKTVLKQGRQHGIIAP